MKPTFYNFESSPDALRFEFDSVSPQKSIRKIVEYTPLPQNSNIYNLGFGDLQEDGSIDDLIVSDNNDTEMVLSTIVRTIFSFFENRPEKTVLFLGSTESRTRLYQIIISKYIDDAKDAFQIRGIRNNEVENFVKGVSYNAFLINLKITKS
jgi:hypothetical protein